MPLTRCTMNGKPGWKWGEGGNCYAYTPGDPKSEAAARQEAMKQAAAILINQGTRPKNLGKAIEREAGK